MKSIITLFLLLILSACAPTSSVQFESGEGKGSENSTPMPIRADLPDLGVAPEIKNQIWLNVDAPLCLTDLRGQVVLIEMWTFG